MPSHKDCNHCQSYLPMSDGCLRIAHGLKCVPPAEELPVATEEDEAFKALKCASTPSAQFTSVDLLP